jgi:hypothetical protein
MSYPLFAIGDDRGFVAETSVTPFSRSENVDYDRQDCQKKDIVCGDILRADALAGVNTIQETP